MRQKIINIALLWWFRRKLLPALKYYFKTRPEARILSYWLGDSRLWHRDVVPACQVINPQPLSSIVYKCGYGSTFFLSGSRKPTNADPDPSHTFESQKVEFWTKNILKVGKRSNNIPTKVQSLLERQKSRFISKFCPIFMLMDLDPHSYSDPDPRQQNEYGSM